MFFPEGQIRVHLYGQPVDMRKSFDGLYAITRQQLGKDPLLCGELFVFVSRRGIQVKILYFDRSGLCVWSKRLEAGRFISDWRAVRTCEMDWTSLKLLLEGIVPAQQRKRFRHGLSPKELPLMERTPLSLPHVQSAHAAPAEHC